MSMLGIICGMEAEAAALGRWREDPRIVLSICAGRPERAAAEAERIAGQGIRALMSWGIGGGLDPALKSGDVVIADGVIVPGGRPVAFDPALVAACRAAAGFADEPARGAGPSTRAGRDAGVAADGGGQPAAGGLAGMLLLAGSDAVLFTPAAKAALRRRTGAAAVDMESHRIAAAARRGRLPSIAVRAVSDPGGRRLPALAADALDDTGRPRAASVLRGVLRRPWDMPALIAAGRDSRAALSALAAAADALIPALLAALERPAAK